MWSSYRLSGSRAITTPSVSACAASAPNASVSTSVSSASERGGSKGGSRRLNIPQEAGVIASRPPIAAITVSWLLQLGQRVRPTLGVEVADEMTPSRHRRWASAPPRPLPAPAPGCRAANRPSPAPRSCPSRRSLAAAHAPTWPSWCRRAGTAPAPPSRTERRDFLLRLAPTRDLPLPCPSGARPPDPPITRSPPTGRTVAADDGVPLGRPDGIGPLTTRRSASLTRDSGREVQDHLQQLGRLVGPAARTRRPPGSAGSTWVTSGSGSRRPRAHSCITVESRR